MWLTARSALSGDGLLGIQRRSATIWGSLALWWWPAHSSCRWTSGVCCKSQEDRQEEGWCQVLPCLRCFSKTVKLAEGASFFWMRVTSCVSTHWSSLSPHRLLKPKRLNPQSAGGSVSERPSSWAWCISKAHYCLGSWLQFSKHLVSEIWADTSKSGVASWHMCAFSFNRRLHFAS